MINVHPATRVFGALLVAAAPCSAAAADHPIDIRPCETPLWLELNAVESAKHYVLEACGAGGVDAYAGSEGFYVEFPNFELRRTDDAWTVAWGKDRRDLEEPGRQTRIASDRRPVPMVGISNDDARKGYMLAMWPRHAPDDVQIHAAASGDQILRELVRVTGVRIDGIDVIEPESITANFISIDRRELIELIASASANVLEIEPGHFRVGVAAGFASAQAQGTDLSTLTSEEFLRAITPREPGGFPQPAIDRHVDLALEARGSGRDAAAIEHLRAALDLLAPYPAGEAELRLRLHVELAELLVAADDAEAARVVLPSVDPGSDAPDLILRMLAVQLRLAQPGGVENALAQVAARLEAIPASLMVGERLLLAAVRAAERIVAGDFDTAHSLQAGALSGWRQLPSDMALNHEPGPQVRRQLLSNELALAAAPGARVAERIAVADWLQQLGGDTPNPDLERLRQRSDRSP